MAQALPDKPPVKQGEEFEFNDSHNLVFDGVARWMKIAGIIEFLFAAAYLIPTVLNLIEANTPPVVIYVLHMAVIITMGIWTIKAGGSVREIVDTEGDDLRHLMEAMGKVKKLFFLQGAIFLIMTALTVVGFFTAGLKHGPMGIGADAPAAPAATGGQH
jgi:hypothetical protein